MILVSATFAANWYCLTKSCAHKNQNLDVEAIMKNVCQQAAKNIQNLAKIVQILPATQGQHTKIVNTQK